MSELKECPFCGVELEKCYEQKATPLGPGVRGVKMSTFSAYKHPYRDCILSGNVVFDDEKSIEAWNTRYERPQCDSAHTDGSGACLGFSPSENDDEPIDACKECPKHSMFEVVPS